MRLHRFYTGPHLELKHDFWLRDKALLWQWGRVLRFKPGQEVILFDGVRSERLYKIISLSEQTANLKMITELVRKLPQKEIYLLWALLKKDKNDLVLQKGTELGVSHFVPITSERTEKTGFNLERAQKIVIEAAEQCGRGDIPAVREPLALETAINEFKDKIQLFVAEQSEDADSYQIHSPVGALVGPEGGWSDSEKELFKSRDLLHLNLHNFTLRAETAAVAAVLKLVQ